MTSPDIDREARRILRLCKDDTLKAYEVVERQLGVLVMRAQVILSLSGIVITVTGFSGKNIAQTSSLARTSVVAGLVIVLLGAAVAVSGVLRLRWLTESIEEDPLATLSAGIALRNTKSRFLAVAMVLFVVGFALYCLAVAQLLAVA
ncbi:MAG: hypothetical protein U0271_45770 [Polyangiaceae bacterium]